MAPGRSCFRLRGPREGGEGASSRHLAGPTAGLLISLLGGRAGVSRVQLLQHHRWERTRGALRAPTQPYLSQHLLLGLVPWDHAPGCRAACRCGVSLEEWHELPVLVVCPISAPNGAMGWVAAQQTWHVPVALEPTWMLHECHGPDQVGESDFLEAGVTYRKHPPSKNRLATIPGVGCWDQ